MNLVTLAPPGRAIDDCWNRIGVNGDRTCPELAEHVHCRNCPVFSRAARTFFNRQAPDGYLADWSDLLGRPMDQGSRDDTALLVFRLGGEWLAMALAVVSEVTTLRPVHRVPHRTNSVFTGMVSLRGQLQLCVSLHGLLEIPATDPGVEPSPHPRLIVIRQGLETWTFPVEEVAGVHRIASEKLEKVPSTLANPLGSFGRAVFAWGTERTVDVLDEARVFASLRRMGA